MIRLLHTADWHLGHTLHGISREYEHRCFLEWLLDTVEEQQADALVIAGDVFDSANPPATAQAMFYHFIAEVRRRCPLLALIVVGGNHDSPGRLEAPQPLLEQLGVRVVGALPRIASGQFDLERLLTPLRNRKGELAGWCAAVPFLRMVDLPPFADETIDSLVEGVRQIYRQVIAAVKQRLEPEQCMIATGHCYMVGTQLSELSERKILGGNQHALPADIFTDDIAYAALGHLHLAQAVGKQEHIRYSGSPIPLSLGEENYCHQIMQVDFERGYCKDITALHIPRSVEILRLPTLGPRPLEEVERELRALSRPLLPPERQPYLEVSVLLDKPEPALRQRVNLCLESKPVRLLKIATYTPGRENVLADSVPLAQLEELSPEQVFSRRYQDRHKTPPPAELLAVFHDLLEKVRGAVA